MLNRLAVRYGTLFVAAAGNSGPFIGSVLEAPGSAAQALSVAALGQGLRRQPRRHALGRHVRRLPASALDAPTTTTAAPGVGDQPPSLGSFSSRGPSGDVWLRPDLGAPGYNIVSAQAATGAALAQNDLNRGTRADPLYATATGTSMATPADGRERRAPACRPTGRGTASLPSGSSGIAGLPAPAYALVRAALMNTAGADLLRGALDPHDRLGDPLDCPPVTRSAARRVLRHRHRRSPACSGTIVLYEVRNGAADPYVGPLGEGAGKLQHRSRARCAARRRRRLQRRVRDRAPTPARARATSRAAGRSARSAAGATRTQRFVLHAAPASCRTSARFAFTPGHPSDGSDARCRRRG